MNLSEATEVLAYPKIFWPEGSVFRMFARGHGRVFGYVVDHPSQLADATTWCDNNGFNSYWQINPTRRRDGTRCSAEDITHWCFMPFDIDPMLDRAVPLLALYEYEDRLAHLMPSDFSTTNRILIDSGRGIQALYPSVPLQLTQPGRYGISQFMSRLMHSLLKDVGEVHGCVLDTSCSDLPRVMRMPYTINQKTGKQASFIAKTRDIAIHTLPTLPEPDPETQVLMTEGADWIDYFPHLTVTARKFIQEGHTEPGRHKAAAATMLSLQEKGAGRQTTRDALLVGNALSPSPLHPKEIVEMVDRRFRKALTVG